MKLTAKVKLLPTPEQHHHLLRTLEAANEACARVSAVAWQEKVFAQFDLHHRLYYELRADFSLSAQMAVRCIAKVAHAYRRDHVRPRTFRLHGAIAYDDRILSWRVEKQQVSIWTVAGRERIAFACGERAGELLASRQGEADLCLMDGVFYLLAVCEIEAPPFVEVEGYLGVDLGIETIAADSDGRRYSGAHINNLRRRHNRLRRRLQQKGTRSARRRLRHRRRKEERFARDVNHVVSRRLVDKAKDTGRGIALEALAGIRDRKTVSKGLRRQLHTWSFNDLQQKIAYKAEAAGVPVVRVDPAYTSKTCPECRHVDKRNRPNRSTFHCVACGFSGHADTVAARNIARRAAVNQPHAAGPS